MRCDFKTFYSYNFYFLGDLFKSTCPLSSDFSWCLVSSLWKAGHMCFWNGYCSLMNVGRNPIKVHQLHKLCLQRRIEQLVVICLPRSGPLLLENEGIWTKKCLCVKPHNNLDHMWTCRSLSWTVLTKLMVLQNDLTEFVDWKAPCNLMARALTLFNCSIHAKWDKQKLNRFVHSENMSVGFLR